MAKKEITDWRDDLASFLITGGLQGRSQSEITAKFNGYASTEAVRNELDALHLEDKIQKFEVPVGRRGALKTIWRATTKMVES